VTAAYVTLVLDLHDAQGQPLRRGLAELVPSASLTDVPGMQVIPPVPVSVRLDRGPLLPRAVLLASDSDGPQPAGWTWRASFTVPGLGPWSFYVPAGPVPFTAAHGSPALLTWTPGADAWQVQALPDGTGVQLAGDDLPDGLQAGATYFVTGSAGTTLQLAAVQGGPPLASLSAGSGTLTVVLWHLSALAPVQPPAQMAGYLTRPAGTPRAGTVPVVQQDGSPVTAWGDPFVDRAGDVMGGPLSPAVTILADAPAVLVDAAAGNEFTLQLTAAVGPARQISEPASPADGQSITFLLVQPETGGPCSVTWADAYDFGSATPPGLSTPPGAADLAAFKFRAALGRWLYLGSMGGY